MIEQATRYGLRRTIELPYDQAMERTRQALQAEGFGVLTEINVRDVLQRKLGVEFRPYTILGACNPPLAHRALTAELDIGLLLPCNVVVRAGERAGTSVVTAMDPEAALELSGNAAVMEVGSEVRARLIRVLEAISAE